MSGSFWQTMMDKFYGQSALVTMLGNFHKGGIQFGETPEQALFRELREKSAYCPNMSRLLRKPKDGCVIVCHIGTFGQTLTRMYRTETKWFLLKLTASASIFS
jgi:putative (di)nucleoside polyphosphate hydrolase